MQFKVNIDLSKPWPTTSLLAMAETGHDQRSLSILKKSSEKNNLFQNFIYKNE
jgi:hypothetical protein